MKYMTEDQVRDKAREILEFENSNEVISGVGQITTVNQLGFKGISDKPDGWYLPKDKNSVAIILETKSEDKDLNNQKFVLEQYKDGASTRQVTKMVENDFKLYKYDLIHSLGHGLGLEIHEPPYISYKTDTVLKENMVVTDEPGIYIPGKFGIRIEDTVQITKFGSISLTNSEKNYIII